MYEAVSIPDLGYQTFLQLQACDTDMEKLESLTLDAIPVSKSDCLLRVRASPLSSLCRVSIMEKLLSLAIGDTTGSGWGCITIKTYGDYVSTSF